LNADPSLLGTSKVICQVTGTTIYLGKDQKQMIVDMHSEVSKTIEKVDEFKKGD